MNALVIAAVLASLSTVDASHGVETRLHVGIPSVCVSPRTGRLWATWYAGPSKGEDLNNYCVLATSADRGRSWREVLVADPDGAGPVRAFDPNVWISPSGKLCWTWSERICPPCKSGDMYTGTNADPKNDRLLLAELDAEAEPSAPYPEARRIGRGVMMNKPIFPDGGKLWLLPVAHWYEAPSACFLASEDGGVTFVERGSGITLPKKHRQFDEHQAVELGDGRLMCYLRGTGGLTLSKSYSSNRGESWSDPEDAKLGHPSTRFSLTRLKSGRLLLIKHGKIGETTRKRSHLRAFVSRNDGKIWEGGLLLDEREGVSYPDACQLADGTIAVVYDYNRVSDRQIQLVLFSERDVLAEAVGKKGVGERHVVSSPTMTLAEGKVSFLSCQPLQYRDMVGKIGF